jgi:hypothetical protein
MERNKRSLAAAASGVPGCGGREHAVMTSANPAHASN